MWLGIIYVCVPVATYLGLAALPRGGAAATGFVLVAFALGVLWLTYALSLPPLFTGDGRVDVYPLAALVFTSAAWVLALAARSLRRAAAGTRRAAKWALVILLGVIVVVPVVFLLGA